MTAFLDLDYSYVHGLDGTGFGILILVFIVFLHLLLALMLAYYDTFAFCTLIAFSLPSLDGFHMNESVPCVFLSALVDRNLNLQPQILTWPVV